jgi:hypothetical protein
MIETELVKKALVEVQDRIPQGLRPAALCEKLEKLRENIQNEQNEDIQSRYK